MRQVTTTKNLYKYDELSESAKQKAIEGLWDTNVNENWWENMYEDASEVGIKITAFDIDRGNSIDGEFYEDACHTANKIKENHGESCETYKTAVSFLAERDEIVNTAPKDENGEFEDEYELDQKLDECENDFLKSILEDYLIMLRKEYEYQTSEESVLEAIKANDYEFTEDGKLA